MEVDNDDRLDISEVVDACGFPGEEHVRLFGSRLQLDAESLDFTPKNAKKKQKKKKNTTFSFAGRAKRKIALRVAYNGSPYHGSAFQTETFLTVEGQLKLACQKVRLIPPDVDTNISRSGRTDTSVNAYGQIISLWVRSELPSSIPGILDWDMNDREQLESTPVAPISATVNGKIFEEFRYAHVLNRILPTEIRILGWCPVAGKFHARYDCMGRAYKYFFPRGGLNIDLMRTCAKELEGENNFRNFCKINLDNGPSFNRRIDSFSIDPLESSGNSAIYVMHIKGSGFLYHQVRCMAAVLFMVGSGKEKPSIVKELLDVEKFGRKPVYRIARGENLVLVDSVYSTPLQWITDEKHSSDLTHNLTLELMNKMVECEIAKGRLECYKNMNAEFLEDVRKDVKRGKDHVALRTREKENTYEELSEARRGRELEAQIPDAKRVKR